jgi:FkbM family methyltransferase
MLELHSYDAAIVGFFYATAPDPDILVDADIGETSIVLDVGAFVGEWSERVQQRYAATIYAFEPSPDAFRSLRRRLGDAPNVSLFEVGLSDRDAVTSLDLSQGPGATLFGDPSSDRLATVHVRDVVGMLAELQLDHIDLLKVNIEGAEYDLFDRLIDAGWLERIGAVSVQFHEWHPHAHRRRRRIRRELARTHDQVWNYPWVWELWKRHPTADTAGQKMIGTESPG